MLAILGPGQLVNACRWIGMIRSLSRIWACTSLIARRVRDIVPEAADALTGGRASLME